MLMTREIYLDNLIDITPSNRDNINHTQYTNLSDHRSNQGKVVTSRMTDEKKTEYKLQAPRNNADNWFSMSREGQPLYYNMGDRNQHFLYQNSLNRPRLKWINNQTQMN